MSICVPFMIDFPYNDEVDEFTIKYSQSNDKYIDLVKFVEEYPSKRINIQLTDSTINYDPLVDISNMHPQIYYLLGEEHINEYQEFQARELRFFFGLIVTSWDALHSSIAIHPSDIFISGQIGFSIEAVAALLEENNIRSRAILNFAQLENPFNTNDKIKAFFIRPEDVEIYSEYINTFEFFYLEKYQVEVLYEIYINQKVWFGNLNDLIVNLDFDVDNTTLPPDFTYFRLNCAKRCFQGSSCNICLRFLQLSEKLAEKNIYFTQSAIEEQE